MTDLEEARLKWRPKVLPASLPAGAARPPQARPPLLRVETRARLSRRSAREEREGPGSRGLPPAQRRQAPRVPCVCGLPAMCLTFDDIPLFGILVFVQRKMGLITHLVLICPLVIIS